VRKRVQEAQFPPQRAPLLATMQQLHFGLFFNKPVDKLTLPAGLQQLHVSRHFDLAHLVRPASLRVYRDSVEMSAHPGPD
jgi:hypothetical protein